MSTRLLTGKPSGGYAPSSRCWCEQIEGRDATEAVREERHLPAEVGVRGAVLVVLGVELRGDLAEDELLERRREVHVAVEQHRHQPVAHRKRALRAVAELLVERVEARASVQRRVPLDEGKVDLPAAGGARKVRGQQLGGEAPLRLGVATHFGGVVRADAVEQDNEVVDARLRRLRRRW